MNRVEEYEDKIVELQELIVNIQAECSHPANATNRIAKSSTGHYDPSQDAYWFEFYCTLCKKSWTEPQKGE